MCLWKKNKKQTFHGRRLFPLIVRMICSLFYFSLFFAGQLALAQTADNKNAVKVGKGKRMIQRKLCQVPINGSGFSEGDLAEVVDNSGSRIAVVKIERLKRDKLIATVITGEDKCSSLRGLAIKSFTPDGNGSGSADVSSEQTMLLIAPRYQVAQTALPGLALNKFLTPGYTQKGLEFSGLGIFPRTPIPTGPLKINFKAEGRFSNLNTSPVLDLVRDGKILGTQNIATQAITLRGGGRINYLASRAWTGAGLVLVDSYQSKSTLTAGPNAGTENPVFPVVRDLKVSGFGIYGEQGFILNNSAIVALGFGLGLGTKVSTPIVEDGDATNTAEELKLDSPPVYLEARLAVPFIKWIFAEVSIDYRKLSLTVPLINNGVSKAQFDLSRISAGVGFRY